VTAERSATLARVQEQETVLTGVRLPTRIRYGMREWTNWLQFIRYAVVGISGYAVSISVFALLYHLAGAADWLAATGAFCCALTNNFVWNRYWTFRAGDGHMGFQAGRFIVVNVVVFLFSLVVLRVLIDLGVPPVAAQAVAVLAAAPPNYIGHRLWSFRV
jgi:putative flippase GtrA